MNMKIPFQFAILRYIHDPITEEFLNVGVVIYSKDTCYFKARVSTRYSRLSQTFVGNVNGDYYRRLVGHIERQIALLNNKLQSSCKGLPLNHWPSQIETLLTNVLPKDNSSLVFGGYGGGIATDLDAELNNLYERLIERYQDKGEVVSRSDDDVWDTYKPHLIKRKILHHLEPVAIKTPTYSQDFRYAWKNERYHPIEPVSLDMVYAHSIRSKTAKWLGNAQLLSQNRELGILYLLVGKPSRPALQKEYDNAILNLREQMQVEHRIVEEDEAEEFSKDLAYKIATHLSEPVPA